MTLFSDVPMPFPFQVCTLSEGKSLSITVCIRVSGILAAAAFTRHHKTNGHPHFMCVFVRSPESASRLECIQYSVQVDRLYLIVTVYRLTSDAEWYPNGSKQYCFTVFHVWPNVMQQQYSYCLLSPDIPPGLFYSRFINVLQNPEADPETSKGGGAVLGIFLTIYGFFKKYSEIF